MPTLHGWKAGLAGAAVVTIGVVIAALIAAGVTTVQGGDTHVSVPAGPRSIALAPKWGFGAQVAASSTSRPAVGRPTAAAKDVRSPRLIAESSPLPERRDRAQAPAQQAPVSGGHSPGDASSAPPAPVAPTPKPGGGGTGGGGGAARPPASLGDTVKGTTQQLANTVDGTTRALGNAVGSVSPALGNTVKQTGPALGNTVEGTGDLVGNTVDGLLGGHR